MFPLILNLQYKLISYTNLNHFMELMKSMGKLKSKVGERSRQNVEPTPEDEGRKKVMKKKQWKFCTNNSRSCMEVHTCEST